YVDHSSFLHHPASFFLRLLPPPLSTLFPYTTLFRSTLFSPGPPPDELGFTPAGGYWRKQVSVTDLSALWQSRLVGEYRGEPCLRSEEHTSELQSLRHLVCRLLLEKKKKNIDEKHNRR